MCIFSNRFIIGSAFLLGRLFFSMSGSTILQLVVAFGERLGFNIKMRTEKFEGMGTLNVQMPGKLKFRTGW